MDREHLEMILTSPYIESVFLEKNPVVDGLPRKRVLEYIMTGGVRTENERDFISFVSYIIGVKHIDLTKQKADESLVNIMPFKVAYAYKTVPLGLKEGVLEVACLDPVEDEVIEDVRVLTGHLLKPYLCGKAALDDYLEKLYHRSWIDSPVKDFEEDMNVFEAVPDIYRVFLDVLKEADEQGAESVLFQKGKGGPEIFYSVDGVESRAYVPPVFEKKYDLLIMMLKAKKEKLKIFDPSLSYHFFIDGKPLLVDVFLAPTSRGGILRIDIPKNRTNRIPDLSLNTFTKEEMEHLVSFREKKASLIFVSEEQANHTAFFYALAELLSFDRKRTYILEDEPLHSTDAFFHVLSKDVRPFTAEKLKEYFSFLSPDLLALRGRKTLDVAADMAGVSYFLDIPVIVSLPFKKAKDILSFLSGKAESRARVFFPMLSKIAVLEAFGFRCVCPLCSTEKVMRPCENDLLKDVSEKAFTVKEAGACPSCHERGYLGQEFLVETHFLMDPGAVKDHNIEAAFKESAFTGRLREKAAARILKRQTTLQEMERVLLEHQ